MSSDDTFRALNDKLNHAVRKSCVRPISGPDSIAERDTATQNIAGPVFDEMLEKIGFKKDPSQATCVTYSSISFAFTGDTSKKAEVTHTFAGRVNGRCFMFNVDSRIENGALVPGSVVLRDAVAE